MQAWELRQTSAEGTQIKFIFRNYRNYDNLSQSPTEASILKRDANELPHLITGVCLEVHRQLGPGLPGAVYRNCLERELRMRELQFERNSPLLIMYRGEHVPGAEITLDFVVEDQLVVLVSAGDDDDIEAELTSGRRELETYLRLFGLSAGLWVNFNVDDLRTGMRRVMIADREVALGAVGAGFSRN